MNKINFNSTGGFPLSTNILDAMQNAYSLFNCLGSLAGNFAIISGCEITGNSVADGVVFIKGELYTFKGGSLGTNVIIKEETTNKTFEDGSTKPVIMKRYATFGSSTPQNTFAWNDFKRVFPTTMLNEKHLEIENRLKKLEDKKSPVPIGLVAIWGKPANIPIPEGWKEYKELRGKMPVGQDPNYTMFSEFEKLNHHLNQIGYEGGELTHRLTVEEMPAHSHKVPLFAGGSATGARDSHPDNYIDHNRTVDSHSVGGNEQHENMPPYRVIRFIEYVGFEN